LRAATDEDHRPAELSEALLDQADVGPPNGVDIYLSVILRLSGLKLGLSTYAHDL
jgi:hypothetical protein